MILIDDMGWKYFSACGSTFYLSSARRLHPLYGGDESLR